MALSKADALTPEAIKAQTAKLKKACKKTPLVLSSASGQGVPEALRALRKVIDEAREGARTDKRSGLAAVTYRHSRASGIQVTSQRIAQYESRFAETSG